ncbi:capsid portal protein [Human betaherpesvirus 5]|uniref:Capsid portal protein n=1 Tax=Human cytomegalovirus TaxID=10359 RepID=V9LRL9_HCMV|nr:capsid portal protein [Human betaherpesvirus 5]AHJ83328.1 capsid portal protein [Human betaherpesvirus 5]AIL27966.1 Capsid portal protein [Human betaherpesvirus 5]AKI16345.1 capsid portal protein [Human betaherpesvirus 5]AKI22693.1 capsid portal protein [Human betaherpesvirus 5]
MERNHWNEKSSGAKRSRERDLTLSTIRSILAADERLRIKASSYLGVGRGVDDEAVIDIFPTGQTMSFLRLLHGFLGTCRGQSMHQVLRDPCVLRKQLLYGVCKTLFDTITVRRVAEEWKLHAALFPYRALDEEDLEQYLLVWSASLRQSVQTGVLGALRDILYQYADNDDYGLYVDWCVTVGLVPLLDVKTKPSEAAERAQFVRAAVQRATETHPLAQDLLQANLALLLQVAERLGAVRVANAPEVRVFKKVRSERLEAQLRGKHIRLYVAAEPLAYERDKLLFTTPVAHLHEEILRYDGLCRHQKICQLLNTFPVKVVTASRHELNCKKLVEMMEQHDRGSDAKKSIMKFLLNVSDSKSRIGIEDSVESFLQDLTPSLVDQNRLLPARGPGGPGVVGPGGAVVGGPAGHVGLLPPPPGPAAPERDIRDLFKKQVIKCLEEQIQSQVDEIQDLRTLNQTWENRVRELRDLLTRYASRREDSMSLGARDAELYHLPVLEAVRKARDAAPFRPLAVEDNRLVANSFFSQFVPGTESLERFLTQLWENEYFRTFRLRRLVTHQGAEEAIVYSNYTVERVTLPYLCHILALGTLDPVPEAYLQLSFGEIVAAAYDDSKFCRYVELICSREKARRRQMSRETAGGVPERGTASSGGPGTLERSAPRRLITADEERRGPERVGRFRNGGPDDPRRAGGPYGFH